MAFVETHIVALAAVMEAISETETFVEVQKLLGLTVGNFHAQHAEMIAALDCPVFACTPDQFPDLMAAALTHQDISRWAGARDIALVRGT